MPVRLPLYINPERATARGFDASGEFALEKMDRLRERLFPPFGKVTARLKFNKDGRRKSLVGHVSGEMIIECQRCMLALEMPVDHQFKLGLVETEAEIDGLLPDEEPLMISNEDLFLADIIEDELELLLPMVAMHDVGTCEKRSMPAGMEEIPEEEPVIEEKRPNPFAAWGDLKTIKPKAIRAIVDSINVKSIKIVTKEFYHGCSKKQKITFKTWHASFTRRDQSTNIFN